MLSTAPHTDTCSGAGHPSTFSVGDTYGRASGPHGATRAATRCPDCAWRGDGRVIRSSRGIKLGTPLVLVPSHRPVAR